MNTLRCEFISNLDGQNGSKTILLLKTEIIAQISLLCWKLDTDPESLILFTLDFIKYVELSIE